MGDRQKRPGETGTRYLDITRVVPEISGDLELRLIERLPDSLQRLGTV